MACSSGSDSDRHDAPVGRPGQDTLAIAVGSRQPRGTTPAQTMDWDAPNLLRARDERVTCSPAPTLLDIGPWWTQSGRVTRLADAPLHAPLHAPPGAGPGRLALLSDIHGNLPALQAVLADLRRRGVDAIANLGDSLSGPLRARDTAALLMAQAWPTLAGNHERQLLTQGPGRWSASDANAAAELGEAERRWMAGLPGTLTLAGGEILLCHGTPGDDLAYFLETVVPPSPGMPAMQDGRPTAQVRVASADEVAGRLGPCSARLVACGHTHLPRVLRGPGGVLIVNPGSVGLPAYDDDHPCLHWVETGSPDARYAIAERRDGRWMAELIAVPYDAEPMAALAEQRGQPEWAVALRRGYMG